MVLQPLLIGGQWAPSQDAQDSFRAVDPTSGKPIGPDYPVSGPADVEAALSAASAVAAELAATPPARIAAFLEAYAAAIEADADNLFVLANRETALPIEPRLSKAELPRTCNQLRLAARAVRDHAWTQPVIDTAAGLRSHFAPLSKPVLVFGPNNFPFAFNAIAGSDFASALAARNPVIAKAHPSHPATCERLAQLAHKALLDNGLPAATVQMLYRFDSSMGLRLAGDPRMGAVGFTGSRHAGLALKAAGDKAGVPVYAEMSSVNPVFLLPAALETQAEALASEFFASCTMGAGQFCTNPGIVIVPKGAAGDRFVSTATTQFAAGRPGILFSAGVREHLINAVATLREAGAEVLAGSVVGDDEGYGYPPTLLQVDAATFLSKPELQSEAFGPVSLLVRVADLSAMVEVAVAFEGNLTGTIYRAADGSDDPAWCSVAEVLRPRVGRLIANRMPTGVAVSAAMNHGGPFPCTGHPAFTAVGMPAAIHRFVALHSYDQVPDTLLPHELRDANPDGIQRCVDGEWTRAAVESQKVSS